MKVNRTRREARAGFTLLEILVVILIIGLLVGVVGTNVFNALIRGQKSTVSIQIEQLKGAINLYRINNANKLPDELYDLEEPDPVTGESYLDGKVPKDPWGNEYDYSPNQDGTYLIISYGADGEPGGEGDNADISNESLDEEE